jgi:hypothetical protein
MRRGAAAVVVLLVACSQGPRAEFLAPIPFHAISEKQNASFCVVAPNSEIAVTEKQWIDVFDQETQCRPARDIKLPDVDFKHEVGVAVWWRVESCLGFKVHTDSVGRIGSQVVVSATMSSRARGACAAARGELESFLVLERTAYFTGNETFKFILTRTGNGTSERLTFTSH